MKDRWLQPIIDGKVRSSFVMTEPHPGGSDPGMMLTRDEKRRPIRVTGRKWFISGAAPAISSSWRARPTARARANGLPLSPR